MGLAIPTESGSRQVTERGGIFTNAISSAYTLGTDNQWELYNGVIYATASLTITLPSVEDRMNFTVFAVGDVTVTVDPDSADLIYLDGTALAAGVAIISPGSSGDMAVFSYYGANAWYAATNTWTQ